MKEYNFLLRVGALGSIVGSFVGGWDTYLRVLLVLMVIDYFTGIIVAWIFKASKKSSTGGLSSQSSFKGLIRKGMMLIMVIVGYQIDIIIGWNDFVRNAVIFGFIANEVISIKENAELMGIPISSPIKKALAILQDKGDVENENDKRN